MHHLSYQNNLIFYGFSHHTDKTHTSPSSSSKRTRSPLALLQFWKAQFEEIMKESGATNSEELRRLTKWLGPTSSRYAATIRSSNVSDTSETLVRICECLRERYGNLEHWNPIIIIPKSHEQKTIRLV